MKFIKGARTWRSILGVQTFFWPLTPPPPGVVSTSHSAKGWFYGAASHSGLLPGARPPPPTHVFALPQHAQAWALDIPLRGAAGASHIALIETANGPLQQLRQKACNTL